MANTGERKRYEEENDPVGAVSTALHFGVVPLACMERGFLSGSGSQVCDGDPCLACVVRILAQPFGRELNSSYSLNPFPGLSGKMMRQCRVAGGLDEIVMLVT